MLEQSQDLCNFIIMNELCYANNPKSLFRKYNKLISGLTKHQLFRDFVDYGVGDQLKREKGHVILLPNGFIAARDINSKGELIGQANLYTKAVYAPKLYSALQLLDNINQAINFIKSPKDLQLAQEFIAWATGLRGNFGKIPAILTSALAVMHPSQLAIALPLIGLTTHDFYPDAHPETTSVDGEAYRGPRDESFATGRAAAGDASQDSNSTDDCIRIDTTNLSTNSFSPILRGMFLVDGSALTADATVTAVDFKIYVNSKNDVLSQSLDVCTCTPGSNTAIVTSDYNIANHSDVSQISSPPTIASISTGAYLTLGMNATGIGNFSKTGVSKYSTRGSSDRANSAPTWASTSNAKLNINFAESASNKPTYTVTFTGGPLAGSGSFLQSPFMKSGNFRGPSG